MRIKFPWQSCNYSATVGPMAVSGHVRPFKTVSFTLFALIHLLLFSDTTLFTLPPSNFLLSLFFPWKIRCIRSGEVVQPKTWADRRTQFVTDDLFCQFCHFGFFLHFLPLSFPFPLLYLLRCCFVNFFFLLKFIFQDFVEYQNVWPCWVCSLCALSKSYFLLSISQYWERFENVSFFFFFWCVCVWLLAKEVIWCLSWMKRNQYLQDCGQQIG